MGKVEAVDRVQEMDMDRVVEAADKAVGAVDMAVEAAGKAVGKAVKQLGSGLNFVRAQVIDPPRLTAKTNDLVEKLKQPYCQTKRSVLLMPHGGIISVP